MTEKESLELASELADAKLRSYTLKTFRRFTVDLGKEKSKAKRIVNKCYVTVYSLWHGRLLARTFYIEQGFEKKTPYEVFLEVKREAAGCRYCITKHIENAMGLRICYCAFYLEDWVLRRTGTFELYDKYHECLSWLRYNDYRGYLSKSMHKYCAYDLFGCNIDKTAAYEHALMFRYLERYDAHPQIEMLVKMGLGHIVFDTRYVRWSKKGWRMLGIEKDEIQYLKAGLSLTDYRRIRSDVHKYGLTADEAKYYAWAHKVVASHVRNADFRTICYLLGQNRGYHVSVAASDYKDYLSFIEKLGRPKTKEILYPDDLHEAHNEAMHAVQALEKKIHDEKMRKFTETLEELRFESDGLMIRPAYTQEDLSEESRVLNHCVRTYADRVANGLTAIMFIRQKSDEDMPYVTLELRKKKVIQCRAKNNKVPEDRVVAFVNSWCSRYELQSCFGG